MENIDNEINEIRNEIASVEARIRIAHDAGDDGIAFTYMSVIKQLEKKEAELVAMI